MKESLKTSEWLLISTFLILLASLAVYARLAKGKMGQPVSVEIAQVEESVSIAISGAVAKPGVYAAKVGSPLRVVVNKSRPLKFADLKSLDLERRIEDSFELIINELSEISVRVQGAVAEPVELRVPAGSRVSDLKSKVILLEDADPKILKSRRVLRDGEVVEIPKSLN